MINTDNPIIDYMQVVLDESVDTRIEKQLQNQNIETLRPEKGVNDVKVLSTAINHESPLITRDQSDFIKLNQELDHPGIYIDKQMHLRQPISVAQAINKVLTNKQEYENQVVFLSNFYGA